MVLKYDLEKNITHDGYGRELIPVWIVRDIIKHEVNKKLRLKNKVKAMIQEELKDFKAKV